MSTVDSFGARGTLEVGDESYEITGSPACQARGWNVAGLPYSLGVAGEPATHGGRQRHHR